MAQIMCAAALRRRLGASSTSQSHGRPLHGIALGPWAATLFRDNDRDLVLAVSERTHLAIVFPFASAEEFRASFAEALRAVLEDLGLSADLLEKECQAIAFEPLVRLPRGGAAQLLKDVQYFCELELMYHVDLRGVQLKLSELPLRSGDVPSEAVRKLLGDAVVGKHLVH